jgi:hypothetical protein
MDQIVTSRYRSREGARWWIVDIPIVQWQLITLKKEDQRNPKGTHRIP